MILSEERRVDNTTMGVKRNTEKFWAKKVQPKGWKREGDTASLRCPKCGTWKGVDVKFIDKEGHSTKTLSCGEMVVSKLGKRLVQERCMFSDYVHLVGWKA